MKDLKAAKKLIKLAKEHPDWYSKKDVFYAKMMKKQLKKEKKETEDELDFVILKEANSLQLDSVNSKPSSQS